RQFHRQRRVEGRIAVAVVTVAKSFVGDRNSSARALGHILPGHFDMDTAGVGSFGAVYGEEALHFRKDAVEWTSLIAAFRLDHVAVHRIAAPHHRMAFALHSADQARQPGFHLVVAEAADQSDAARFARRVERIKQLDQRIGLEARATLHADWIADTA